MKLKFREREKRGKKSFRLERRKRERFERKIKEKEMRSCGENEEGRVYLRGSKKPETERQTGDRGWRDTHTHTRS